jgi:alpha-tubulin suppressor-like RCC1 family protein
MASNSNATPTSARRSSRRKAGADPIIAPGFGTSRDMARLTRDLGGSLPQPAVEAMMQSKGRGIRGSNDPDSDDDAGTGTGVATTTGTSAWADFMKEEGGSSLTGQAATGAATATKATATDTATTTTTTTAVPSNDYDLSGLTTTATEEEPKTKKTKTATYGSLVQSGTLDPTLVGRKSLAKNQIGPQHLYLPTVLLPKIAITKVFTSCNAAHAICLAKDQTAYGWGRNEQLQLGSALPTNVITPQIIAHDVGMAALGKSHTLILSNGVISGLGSNKSGQCGWKPNVKSSGVWKASNFSPTTTVFVKMACGEDFSAAICNEGYLYTTGSSEFGQLANGETGEYFVSASKLAFTNGYGWARQTNFYQDAGVSGESQSGGRHSASEQAKPQLISTTDGPIKLQDVACGKHFGIVLEAPCTAGGPPPRVFTWGNGNYGCLGHGRQKDEYYPRHVSTLPAVIPMSVQAGSLCSLVLTNQGHVYYWGKHRSVGEAVMRPQLVDALANNQHVVTHMGAGGQTVACTTNLGATVVWGQGPMGELGLGDKKSSAKPAFVDSLHEIQILDLACGQGSMLYVVEDDTGLPVVDVEAVQAELAAIAKPQP